MNGRHGVHICLVLCALLVWAAGCKDGEGGPRGPRGGNVEVNAASLVETAPVEVGPFSVDSDYAGEVTAERTAEIAFEVSGRLVELDLDIGDRVERGETLARIAPISFRQQLREATAAVGSAEASLAEAEVAAENIKDDLDRKEPLLEKSLITGREVADLEAQFRQAEQRVAVARAELEQRRSRVETAREDMRNTTVRAPFDARIAKRHVDLGTYVGPTDPVFRLVSDKGMYVRVEVPEREASNVTVGQPVTVRLGSLGGVSLPAEVVRVAPAADANTRSVRVDVGLDLDEVEEKAKEAEQDESSGDNTLSERIRPGMYAQVQIELADRDEAVTIPKQALLEDRGGVPYVWLDEDRRATRREVLVGLRGRDRVEITDGLEGGERIILRGFERLEDGDEVETIDQDDEGTDDEQGEEAAPGEEE